MNLFDLSPGALKLFLAIRYFANSQGECWPSQDTLMRIIGISRKSVFQRIRSELKNCDCVSYKMSPSTGECKDGLKRNKWKTIYKIIKTESDNLYLSINGFPMRQYIDFRGCELQNVPVQNVTLTNIYKEQEYLKNLTNEEIDELAKELSVAPAVVRSCAAASYDWLQAEGKTKKNYRSFLKNWIRNQDKFSPKDKVKPKGIFETLMEAQP